MKRYFIILAVFAALAAFIGCASTPSSGTSSQASATAQQATTEAKPVPEPAKPVQAALPAGDVLLLDNFEDGNYWVAVKDSWDQWGAHNLSLEAELYEKWGTDGPTSGDWVFDKIPAAGGQATFYCDQLIETNWTGAKYIVIDINNPQAEALTICFSCQTTDGWKWTQTKTLEAPPGISTLVFDLTKDLLDGSNTPVKAIDGIDQMKRAMFNVVKYGKNGGSGRFYVDNIRLIK
jgi:hypothetical protein